MCSLTRVLLTLSAIYFLDDSEAEQSGEIDTNFNFTDASYSFEDDENKTASTYGKWYGNEDAPSSVYRIVADGNCLFRAVSYVVSGSQEHHRMLRKLVVEKMYDMGCEFKRITGQNASEYVARTKMNEPGVWGTDVEILCALLKTPIFIFLLNDSVISLIPHYPSSFTEDFTESECIYLRNKRYHFGVVLEM